MTTNQQSLRIVFVCAVFFLLFSCEKEDTDPQTVATQLLPIRITSASPISGNGDLMIINPGGRTQTYPGLAFGETLEIEADLSEEGNYTFAMEDPNLGRIKLYATKEVLEGFTLGAPFTLQFEHYKNETIATFTVASEIGPNLRIRNIDLIVYQGYGSLYHIDWGDGTEEVAEAPAEYQNDGDPVSHQYAASGEYTITLRTTHGAEVTGLELQYTANGNGDRIQTLTLENLSNLNYLSLGDSDMLSVDTLIEQYPELTHLSLRFGALNSIDVSKNPKLEFLNITGNYDTTVKGLSGLTRLKGLGITGTIENLDLGVYPELTSLTLRGHDFTVLDLSTNPNLTTLTLQLNGLEQIDLSANTQLQHLSITNNNLTGLDIANSPEIVYLDLYANYIEELNLAQQTQLEFLNLSSVHIKQVAAPESWDAITHIDLTNARFLDEADLLDAVFQGQVNNPKTKGIIRFNEFAVVLDRQIPLLHELVNDHDWTINVPD
nr:hypothetical protein [Allomuricauda sp.]